MTVTIGVDCTRHRFMSGWIVKQTVRLGGDLVGFGPYKFKNPRFNPFRSFGYIAKYQSGHPEGWRFLLDPARIGEDEAGVFHQMNQREVVERREQADVRDIVQ